MSNSHTLKAVIPVAGLGTRMLPATKAIPKEMLTIADKPLIQYIVNECVEAGIKEIILVTHSSKNAIENHFDTSFELESILEKRVKRQLLEEIQTICPKDVCIFHVRQKKPLGLGHAILCAYPIIRDHPFVVLLPDVLLKDSKSNLKQMMERFMKTNNHQVLVEPIEGHITEQYGIANIDQRTLTAGKTAQISSFVEKPKPEDSPSNLAIVGRYVFGEGIWPALKNTAPGKGDEIQLTDAIAKVLEFDVCEAFHIIDKSYDCGNKVGYMKAFVEYSLQHPQYGEEFKTFLDEVASQERKTTQQHNKNKVINLEHAKQRP